MDVETFWLINELARTDNVLEAKRKFERTFKKEVSESILQIIITEHAGTIKELKLVKKNDIESHEYASPYRRMDEFVDIKDRAKKGLPVVDKEGNFIGMVPDLKTELAAVKACREEQQMVYANELKLLDIMIKNDKLNKLTIQTGEIAGQTVSAEDITDTKLIGSDNDKYFDA